MKEKQVIALFKSEVLPAVVLEYERDGIPDKPARREAFNNFVDSLARDGKISRELSDTIVIPDDLQSCPLTWQEIERYKKDNGL